MHCAAIRKQLNRYHDGELPPEARKETEGHLTACASCRAALARLKAVDGFWAALDRSPLPERFASRVTQIARQRAAARLGRAQPWWAVVQWWWRDQSLAMQAATAAVVLAGSLTGFLFSGSLPLSASFAWLDRPAGDAGRVIENLDILSGAPEGSLEQTYLAWAFSPEPTEDSR